MYNGNNILTASTTLNNYFFGTAGNLTELTANSLTFTLSKSSGTVTCNYVKITGSAATGGATWRAANSINNGGNTGWVFTYAISIAYGSYVYTGQAINFPRFRKRQLQTNSYSKETLSTNSFSKEPLATNQ